MVGAKTWSPTVDLIENRKALSMHSSFWTVQRLKPGRQPLPGRAERGSLL